ncbi:hypothetical protein Ancab_020903 [Ancistrocladus abbreviatus]
MDDRWIWNLTWKRELREAEKCWERDLLSLLARQQPDRDSLDAWKWGKDGNGSGLKWLSFSFFLEPIIWASSSDAFC